MKRNFNPLALIGLIGFFGFLGPLTGRESWYWWFPWFLWFTYYNKPTDERFFSNLSKASLPCFAITFLGLMVLIFMKELGMSQAIIFSGLEILFAIAGISFLGVLKYFGECG